MNILFIGDVISRPGRKALKKNLQEIRAGENIDVCVANVENAAGIFGVTARVINEILDSGVDVMTSGNHIWDKKEGVTLLEERDDLLRPANYPPGVPGKGMTIKSFNDIPVAILNLQGRTFMAPIDCPFRVADKLIDEIPEDVRVRIVDFHAEATSEKIAFGYYLDGRVSAVIGTHTHVQTADEKVLPGGTAYITDAGMTGPIESVIGVKSEQILKRFLTGIPCRMNVASGQSMINGVVVNVDENTGKAIGIKRLNLKVSEEEEG